MLDHMHHQAPQVEDRDDAPEQHMDAAGQSLVRALRLSFRLLTLIMMVVVVLFALTGMQRIETGHVGIKSVFGKIVGVVGPGLQYTWPFPVGNIETVDVRTQRLLVGDFWMFETPQDLATDLAARTAPEPGLRPGLDGALLTGDKYLIHAELECRYTVPAENVLDYKRNMLDVRNMIHSAMCSAAIRSAASRTAEGLMGGYEQDMFKSDVHRLAQERLNRIGAGVSISQVNLTRTTWPIRALPEYAAAQRASQQSGDRINKARAEAEEMLGGAAGMNYVKLVGEPWRGDIVPEFSSGEPKEYNLIGQYERLRHEGKQDQALAVWDAIDRVLVSQTTTGEVSRQLTAAAIYKDGVKQSVMGRVRRYEELLGAYKENPEFLMSREMAKVREEILASDTVVKWFMTFGSSPTVLQINTPPEITKELRQAWLQAARDRARQAGPSRPAGAR